MKFRIKYYRPRDGIRGCGDARAAPGPFRQAPGERRGDTLTAPATGLVSGLLYLAYIPDLIVRAVIVGAFRYQMHRARVFYQKARSTFLSGIENVGYVGGLVGFW